MEIQRTTRQRQHSDPASMPSSASSTSPFNGHWPPIEWDPLKLNPPVRHTPAAPPRLHERQPLQTLRPQRSFAGHESRRRPRLHHSDSGFTFVDCVGDFDFKQERAKALQIISNDHQQGEVVNMKGWPSPASSIDSDKSWFDMDDDSDQDEDDVAVERSNAIWDEAPSPQRRPQISSPDDPTNFIKRGAWKRKAIFFGGQTEEVYQKDDDAFEI